MKKGCIHIYTGDGKGKTSAALGLCLRAAGAGLKVFIAQFLKKADSSEIKAVRAHLPMITILQFGTGKFVRDVPCPEDAKAAAKGFTELRTAVMSGKFDVIVADELNAAITLELVPLDEAIDLLRNKPENVELVITGRDAHPQLVHLADLVTVMNKKKHYFDKGLGARIGIDL